MSDISEEPELRGRRILIVEDEWIVAMDHNEMLIRLGCVVVALAINFKEAMRQAETAAIDAAVLDVKLQGEIAVYPVAAKLESRGIPLVFCSAYSKEQIEKTGGLSDIIHVRKPCAEQQLKDALIIALAK
jgi:CheY-like chemotaxis protein